MEGGQRGCTVLPLTGPESRHELQEETDSFVETRWARGQNSVNERCPRLPSPGPGTASGPGHQVGENCWARWVTALPRTPPAWQTATLAMTGPQGPGTGTSPHAGVWRRQG